MTEASRFLGQATFGPTSDDLMHLTRVGYLAWMNEQFSQPLISHQAVIDEVLKTRVAFSYDFYPSFWKQAATGPDQLRQRVKFALSEIFVISLSDVNVTARGAASYYDMLGAGAFGNFRDLLEKVTLHPMMGVFLNSLGNAKEGPNQTPDENFAREVMQLFTIGLYQLNTDGSVKSNALGPIPTYNLDDVTNIAKVFTGFSWSGPDKSDARFIGNGSKDPNRDITPMQAYPQWHSTSPKSFLGVTIQAGSADAGADLKIALDTLFNHPNTGPFIARKLIQRLVTSNPSPAYISRVAAAFANNGNAVPVRGDMKAVIKAVLLDPEARSTNGLQDPAFGKVREPVVRLAQWMRTFKASSQLGTYFMRDTSDPEASLGQSPLTAPSVFNFFRPGYAPPSSDLAARNLVAPELQILNETSVIGYGNFMQRVVTRGTGSNGPANVTPTDVIASSYDDLLPLAANSTQLVDQIDLLLTAHQLSANDKRTITDAVNTVGLISTNPTLLAQAKLRRVQLAVYLTMLAPSYLVQK